MSKKVFPIVNSSACVYKWGWNTFRMQSGRSSSCHRVQPVFVAPENFENFHNTPEVINDRQLMLEGKWPRGRGCEYCEEIETFGGISDRTYHNVIPGLTPVEFDQESQPLNVTPRISEIYINNTCDLACVYCRPEYSSRINQEVKKYGVYPIERLPIEKTSRSKIYFNLYNKWLEENYHKLDSISILGGEPFLQKEFWKLLDNFKNLEKSTLSLQVTTNLNCEPAVLEKFITKCYDLIKHKKIKSVIICCSLDCWGPQAEFVRYGLKLSNWQRNFEYLIKIKWLKIEVHQVVSILTIDTAQELQNKIDEYKKINSKIIQSYFLVDSGHEHIFHPNLFSPSLFEEKLQNLLATFPIATDWDTKSKAKLEGIIKSCTNTKHDINKLKMFKDTMDMTDRRRNTDWKKLYPELENYLKLHGL